MARAPRALSSVDKEVITQIRALRGSPDDESYPLLFEPERLIHRFIVLYGGHAQLRLGAMARELGVEMRTLERSFLRRFGGTMQRFHTETRLNQARKLLAVSPPIKLSAIANLLGYREARDFTRFFRRHVHTTPSDWRGWHLDQGTPEPPDRQ